MPTCEAVVAFINGGDIIIVLPPVVTKYTLGSPVNCMNSPVAMLPSKAILFVPIALIPTTVRADEVNVNP
jgi:hypothetical protein